MLTRDEPSRRIEAGQVDTVLAVFPDLCGRLLGKRITGAFFLDHTAVHGMHACDGLLTADMEMEVVGGNGFANWVRGYGDLHCVPDWSSLRQAAWLERTALVLCDLERGDPPAGVAIAPRTLLATQLARLAAAGYRAMCGSELEFYLFRDSYDRAREKRFEDLEPWGGYLGDYHILQGTKAEAYHGAARRQMSPSGVPVEFGKGEWGPGQRKFGEAVTTWERARYFERG